jgi:shikimate kinase
LRGSGKSAVGARVGARHVLAFTDLDRLIEARAGTTIAELFARDGEETFRKLEREVLAECYGNFRGIVAPGGGAVMDRGNVAVMQSRGPLVWLLAPPQELAQRLAADPATADARPPLLGSSAMEEIKDLFDLRRSHYMGCADLVVDTTGIPPSQVADRIEAVIPHWFAQP